MCKVVGIEDISGNSFGVFPLIVPEHILIALVACTDYHKLSILVADTLASVVDQIESLLIGKA